MSVKSLQKREWAYAAADMAIKADAVCVRYRLAKEKPETLQEYFIHRLKGRRLVYDDFWALRDITVELGRGETLGIIGHNGAGKSTLLKVIAGVVKPTSGSVTVNGVVAPLIELGAGFDPELTGVENIFLNASILGLSRREIQDMFQGVIDFSELGDFIYSPLKNYSSGMVARLGFSVATEMSPDILIVDEILAVGDEHFIKKCENRMRNFRESGTTIILVSHNMQDVMNLCDRVVWLDHGRIKMAGEPQVIISEYQRADQWVSVACE